MRLCFHFLTVVTIFHVKEWPGLDKESRAGFDWLAFFVSSDVLVFEPQNYVRFHKYRYLQVLQNPLYTTCDEWWFLFSGENKDRIFRVCQKNENLLCPRVYLSLLANLELCCSFALQYDRRIAINDLSSNRCVGMIVILLWLFKIHDGLFDKLTRIAGCLERSSNWLYFYLPVCSNSFRSM